MRTNQPQALAISMSSPMGDNVPDDGGQISGVNKLKFSNSPISLEHLLSPLMFHRLHPNTPQANWNHSSKRSKNQFGPVTMTCNQCPRSRQKPNRERIRRLRVTVGIVLVRVHERLYGRHIAQCVIIPQTYLPTLRLPAANFAMTLHGGLKHLEEVFNRSYWMTFNAPEPLVGDPDCPQRHTKADLARYQKHHH